MKGLYQRGIQWWFRYTDNSGAQQRVSLKTCDERDAVIKAREMASQASLPKHRLRQLLGKPALGTFPRITHLYLIQCGALFKIGIAHNVGQRMKQLRTSNPLEMQLLHTLLFECKQDAHTMELALHRHFSNRRVSGEWFNLSPSEVQFVLTLTSASPLPVC